MELIKKPIIKNWYIIKVNCGNNHKTYIKIGEGKESRPEDLAGKYSKLAANTATVLVLEELPHNKDKRLNDKVIHEHIDHTILVPANKYEIQVELAETDGKNEFFEMVNPMTDNEVVAYVKQVIKSIKKSEYRVKTLYNTELVFGKDEYHLVNATFLNIILKQYPEIYHSLYNTIGENILLIGQFEKAFINSIAMFHNVYIWHDAAENKHDFVLDIVNNKIHYIDNLKELLDMNIKFKTVLENAPYGSIGAIINDTVRADVDWEYCVSLLPIKDMPLAGLEACNYLDMTRTRALPPHTFKDADILTHILVFKKEKQNEYKTFKEVVADSFTVDKPFIKFMKANELAEHYAIDNISGWKETDDVKTTFVFHEFRAKSQHTCGMDKLTSKSVGNEYNFNNNEITTKTAGISGTLAGAYYSIRFNTEEEKTNFVNFYKKNRNFINRMIVNQFISIRDYSACFPKVDWTKSDWTVEKILKTITKQIGKEMTDIEIVAVLDTMTKDYEVKTDDDINKLFGDYLDEIR